MAPAKTHYDACVAIQDVIRVTAYYRDFKLLVQAIERLADRLDEFAERDLMPELTDALVARGFNRRTAAGAVAWFESEDHGPEPLRDELRHLTWVLLRSAEHLRGEIVPHYHGIK